MVAVITGASSGIGRATALEFARQGHHVVLLARFAAGLEDLARECEAAGVRAMPVPIDVSLEGDINAMTARVVEAFGQIDVWVNNAAVSVFGPFEDIPTDDVRRVLDINLMGYIYGARAAVRQFRRQGHGTLINISSMIALSGQPYSIPYSVSKAGIRGLSLSLSQELADAPHIHVCCVLPAVIDTPIFQHAANYMGRRVAPPRPVIAAEEVAKAILKLTRHPQDEIMVGNMARLVRAQRMLLPLRLFDKNMQKMIRKQHFREEVSGPYQGNLYDPITNWNKVNGGWRAEDAGKGSGNKLGRITTVGALLLAGLVVGATFLDKSR